MKDRVLAAISILSKDGGLEKIKQSPDVPSRHVLLRQLVPEASFWPQRPLEELFSWLHHAQEIDMGVCPSLLLLSDDSQRCIVAHALCRCATPQKVCEVRAIHPLPPIFDPKMVEPIVRGTPLAT